jgi:hypothetical protein
MRSSSLVQRTGGVCASGRAPFADNPLCGQCADGYSLSLGREDCVGELQPFASIDSIAPMLHSVRSAARKLHGLASSVLNSAILRPCCIAECSTGTRWYVVLAVAVALVAFVAVMHLLAQSSNGKVKVGVVLLVWFGGSVLCRPALLAVFDRMPALLVA